MTLSEVRTNTEHHAHYERPDAAEKSHPDEHPETFEKNAVLQHFMPISSGSACISLHWKDLAMVPTQKRQGFYAWDEQDARSIASNTPSYGGALFTAYRATDPVQPPPGPRAPRLRLATRLKVLARLRPRLVRIGG